MKNKYGNRKITYNGEIYDSIKEYRRHDELKLLERAGKISGLQRQVKFELIPAQRIGGKVVERACTYVADYVYKDSNGILHIEDIKGYKGGGAYAVFTIKRKLMLHVHGLVVEEI